MPLMESDAKRSARISTESSEKVLMSTSAPSPSGSKGLKEFFRRRQKSAGGTPFSVDSAAGEGTFSRALSKTESSSGQSQKSRSNDDGAACLSSYGNYLTISGTGANALRDLFNRKYRSSSRSSYAVHDGESKPGSRKSLQGPMPLFRFRSKKDSIQEEERSPSPEDESKSETKGVKAGPRARHISGPMSSLYGTGLDSGDAKFRHSLRYGSASNAPGARMRTFFDSFRQRTRTVSQDSSGGDEQVGSVHDDCKPSGKISSSKKKFKVTPAFQSSANRKDSQHIGPDEFFRLYRNRANSDPKPEALIDEAGNVLSHKQSTSPHLSKANTIHSYEPLQFVIWRDRKRGTRLFRLPRIYAETFELDDASGGNSEEMVYAREMSSHHCYDLMPSSSKLVICDTQLSVKKAFFALIHNGVRSAPLWDTERQDFVGMLTITDFIQILQKYYKSPQERMEELEEHKISAWKDVLLGYDRPMVVIGPDDSLLEAIRSLCENKVHRLLVVEHETGNALHILTLKRILKFLHSFMSGPLHPKFMHQTLRELKIGSYENIASATPETPLIEALNMFVERRVSALPIVNSDGKVVDIYAKFDILGLAAEKVYYNLDVTITEALKNRREEFEGVLTCLMSERLIDVVERIVNAGVHRLVVVDENHLLKGIVSLSDILHYLVLNPVDLQKLRLAEQQKEAERRRQEEADQDQNEPDFEGLDLMLRSVSAASPDPSAEQIPLFPAEEMTESLDELTVSGEVDELFTVRDNCLESLAEITEDKTQMIPNGAEP